MARDYPDVRANTVASFALGDYEWILAFEADELHRIVDLMRHLRGSETRRHVREEVPFYTGRRRTVARADRRPALRTHMPLLMCDLDDTLVERPPVFRAWARTSWPSEARRRTARLDGGA